MQLPTLWVDFAQTNRHGVSLKWIENLERAYFYNEESSIYRIWI